MPKSCTPKEPILFVQIMKTQVYTGKRKRKLHIVAADQQIIRVELFLKE
jgi:Tfp pilus tip-associated adhesin PilY1